MHKAFSEWYRQAGIEPDGDVLPKRWAAIEAYSPTRDDAALFTRLFYHLVKPTPDLAFIEQLQLADPAFKTRDNDNELSLLAGAALVYGIEQQPELFADIAALSLVCALGGNLRPPPRVRDIPELALTYLTRRSSNRASDGDAALERKREEMKAALATLGAPHDGVVANELHSLRTQLSIVNEEANMLWWLFGEHSRDENARWSKFSVSAAALMTAKELADLTIVVPGPNAASAFLDRAIKGAKSPRPSSIAIKAAINDVSTSWRERFTKTTYPTELEAVTPVSHGISLSLRSPDNDEWLPSFQHETGISPDASIAPSALSLQLYREAMLCRAWNSLS
jgi:hypothetical protein